MVGDAALAGERDGDGFLGLILVQLVEDQRVERVHAVVRRRWGGCGAGRGTLVGGDQMRPFRSEEHTSELQSLMRISYAVFCLKHKIPKVNELLLPSQQQTTHSVLREQQ